MIKHYCGLFGVHNHSDAARLAYFGLYAQQHRGQESAGIAVFDGERMRDHRGMGLVPDVFTEKSLSDLPGTTSIGHVRYSTTGSSSIMNAQPHVARFRGSELAIAHNGNLVNTTELRQSLEDRGSIFNTNNDSEVFMHLIVRALRNMDLEDAVREACVQVRGAYSLLIMQGDKIIALRDPQGFHPLVIGRLGNASSSSSATEQGESLTGQSGNGFGSYVFASETCALDLIEADYLRSVKPGEMVVAHNGEIKSMPLFDSSKCRAKQCIFELVYFARPDSIVFDEQVYLCRKRMGAELAKESTPDADFVMPFPDSGIYSALGFAQCSGIPYEHAMIRNHYVGRTFIQPTQSMRNFGVRVKINPVRAMIEGRKICILDDSIVRGTTMLTRVRKLRELGAKEVHIRISSPPVKFPCFYGIDFASKGELVAARMKHDEITKLLNVDSLHYLSIDGLLRSVAHADDFCLACFDGNYPVPVHSS